MRFHANCLKKLMDNSHPFQLVLIHLQLYLYLIFWLLQIQEWNWMYETCWRECSAVTFLLISIFLLRIGQTMQNYSSHSSCNLTTMCIYCTIKANTLYSNAKYYVCSRHLIYGSSETVQSISWLWCRSSINSNTAYLQVFVLFSIGCIYYSKLWENWRTLVFSVHSCSSSLPLVSGRDVFGNTNSSKFPLESN